MRIIEEQQTVEKPIEISVGDMFRRGHGDNTEWYMFIETQDDVQVINLSGSGRWSNHKTKKEGIEDLQVDVSDGHLIHYPKMDYDLKLSKKEG